MAERVLYDSVKPTNVQVVTKDASERNFVRVKRAAIFNIGQQAFLTILSTHKTSRKPYSTEAGAESIQIVINMENVSAVHVTYPEADNLTQDAPSPNKSKCTNPDCPVHGPDGLFVVFGLSEGD